MFRSTCGLRSNPDVCTKKTGYKHLHYLLTHEIYTANDLSHNISFIVSIKVLSEISSNRNNNGNKIIEKKDNKNEINDENATFYVTLVYNDITLQKLTETKCNYRQ